MNGTNTRGGARPKVREDDGRATNGGARPGAGPIPKTFTLKAGSKFVVMRSDADGNGILPAELWTITSMDRTHIYIQSDNGDSISLVR